MTFLGLLRCGLVLESFGPVILIFMNNTTLPTIIAALAQVAPNSASLCEAFIHFHRETVQYKTLDFSCCARMTCGQTSN